MSLITSVCVDMNKKSFFQKKKECQEKKEKSVIITDYFSSTMNFSTTDVMKENAKPNIKAFNQPPTSKPCTKYAVSFTIAAVITKENNPSVKQVIGKEIIFKIGFKNEFSSVSTKATFTAMNISF